MSELQVPYAGAQFNVLDYGAKGDGSTNDYAAVAAAVTAIVANKGGDLIFPYRPLGYVLGSSVVINVGLYANGSGVTVKLNGNNILPSHTGWCFDFPTNFFGANNGGKMGTKLPIIEGSGAVITTSNAAATGGVRFQDTIAHQLHDIAINGYAAGSAVQLLITSGDLSTWCELGQFSNIKGRGNLQGIYTKSSNALGSFLGNTFKNIAFDGAVNNVKIYNLEGAVFDCVFESVGGFYNQGGATGGNCFYLNGAFAGTTFISPWIDLGGTGTTNAATDIVFGANYTATTAYQPTIVNPMWVTLPVDWRTKLFISGPVRGIADSSGASANAREVLRAPRTYYVSTSGSNSNNGQSAGSPFATIAYARDLIYNTIDAAGQTLTIKLADGTYTTGAAFTGLPTGLGSGSLVLEGNSGTPGNVIISTTSADDVTAIAGARISVKGIEFRTTTAGRALRAEGIGSYIYIDAGCRFGATAEQQVAAFYGGTIEQGAAYTITGNALTHYEVNGGMVIKGASVDATSRAFSANFANVYNGGTLFVNNSTFTTTSSTGTRYFVYAAGLVQTYGAGTTIFPGNVIGFANAAQFAQYL